MRPLPAVQAASAVWDDKHADAPDVPTDDEDGQLQSTFQQSLPAATLLASAASSSVLSPSTSAFSTAVPESGSSAKGKGKAHGPGESGGATARAHKLPVSRIRPAVRACWRTLLTTADCLAR